MSCKTIHDVVYEEVIPMLQKSDNPGMAMRQWLVSEDLDPKDVREVCVALAVKYKGLFDRCEDFKKKKNWRAIV